MARLGHHPDNVTLIAVCGGSGSGKTTFARRLVEILGEDHCAILSQDRYYIDQSDRFKEDGGDVNFDHPSAIDFDLMAEHLRILSSGRPIEAPLYDFATHKRLKRTTTFKAKPVIIVDGILVLSQKQIRDAIDASVFIDIPESVRFERRLRRDTVERGRTPEGIEKQFLKQVKPMHDQFVEPSKAFATFRAGLPQFEIERTLRQVESFAVSRGAFRFRALAIGAMTDPSMLTNARRLLETAGLKIVRDKSTTLSDSRQYIDFECESHPNIPFDLDAFRLSLVSTAGARSFDFSIEFDSIAKNPKKLVVFDLDSTLIENEVIDELAREAGVYDEVAQVTRDAMEGKYDFDESLKRRCEKLRGLSQSAVERVLSRIQFTQGAKELIATLKQLGCHTAILTGGFTVIAEPLRAALGADEAHANTLEFKNGVATGQVLPPLINAEGKGHWVSEIATRLNLSRNQVVAVGDGANDLVMLARAGTGIAFCAKPILAECSDAALFYRDLRSVLAFITRSN